MAQPLGKMIVMAAFDEDDEGNLVPAFDPREFNDAGRAKREAQMIAGKHAGVIAWQRTADPSIGEMARQRFSTSMASFRRWNDHAAGETVLKACLERRVRT